MTTSVNLRQILLNRPAGDIAYDGERRYTLDDLTQRVGQLYASLSLKAEQSVGLWLQSPWDFLCAFLALTLAGKRIVMPHNLQAGAAVAMGDYFSALITDRPAAVLHCPQWPLSELVGGEAQFPGATALAGDVDLILFTSGTTGDPAPIYKRLSDLEAELGELQSAFGDTLGRRTVLATVSHQHIYGLLHLLLWPLLRGAPFVVGTCHYPEVLAAAAERHRRAVLVSSPTHLSRLPDAEVFRRSARAIDTVVSSAGLLDARAADRLQQCLGDTPLEILGSTETGGVAWRRQSLSPLWQPLPQVKVDADDSGCLRVHSRHLGGLDSFVMGDRVRFDAHGQFELLGRADTIVKVEGKRLSLSEMEARLAEHELVNLARAAVVRGRRDEVGAAVVLAEAGWQLLAEQGKRELNRRLREHLLHYFEQPLLPRRWRYRRELPRNAQGKVQAASVREILEMREN